MPLRARLSAVFDNMPGATSVATFFAVRDLRRLGRRIQANARRRVAPHSRTGRLEQSIGFDVRVIGGQARLENFATAPHAKYFHDGTRAHAIRPINARALKFSVGGRTVFARHVWHPGTRGIPFLAEAVAEELARDNR